MSAITTIGSRESKRAGKNVSSQSPALVDGHSRASPSPKSRPILRVCGMGGNIAGIFSETLIGKGWDKVKVGIGPGADLPRAGRWASTVPLISRTKGTFHI